MLNGRKATKELLKAMEQGTEPMINADRIRAMSNGVLAQAIMTVSNGYAPWCTHHCEHSGEDECCDCVRNWLQQPAEESHG